jgi:IS605 OrfB family transposase
MKKKKKKFDIEPIRQNIIKHTDDIWIPKNDIKFKQINKHNYGDIYESTNRQKIIKNIKCSDMDIIPTQNIKATKITLKLSKKQRKIIDKWLYGYKEVYNCTLKYIKENQGKGFSYNWMKIRAHLKDVKNKIAKKYGIKVHDIDYAIKLACQNYKSALTNFRNGNIKTFRIRYWRNDKNIKIIDLEKNNFASGSIRKSILGQVKGYYNGKEYDYSEITKDCKLQKNTAENKYILYVPKDVKLKKYAERQNLISIDPGIRTFMTGITEKKIVEIGKNINGKIKKYINRKENANSNDNIDDKIKMKIEKMCNKKITNKVNELHWKTINYLTKNYNNIIIGDMSTKMICKNIKTNKIDKMTKKIANKMRWYVLHERLKYKCGQTNTKYKIVDECYTSKMCSICGNIKNDLGSSKIYKCVNCKTTIGRDINGCRGILIKSLI